MASFQQRVAAEVEQIERSLQAIPPASELSQLNELELAGVATSLHPCLCS
jgi:hypothetical protein